MTSTDREVAIEGVPSNALVPLLAAWLPEQRWFAGRGRDPAVTAVRRIGQLTTQAADSTESSIFLADVAYGDGSIPETYQVPLVFRRDQPEQLEHARVGWLDGPDGSGSGVNVYDALRDKDVTRAWLQLIIAGDDSDGDGVGADRSLWDSALRGHRGPGVEVEEIPIDEPSLAVSAEQSNTSLVFGDAAILKVFRRIERGRNPDIEVHEALGHDAGAHVAQLLGWVSASAVDREAEDDSAGGESIDLAMLQEFLRTGTDGWALAQISVRDLLAEGDLHAEEVGGDFAAEAYRLGMATAETHAALAEVLSTGDYAATDLTSLAADMRARLAAAASEVPAIEPYVPALSAVFDALATHPAPVPIQRVHGDLHLGQVMRTVRRWVLIDFEGEPAKPITERVALDSPLRDVAGMFRSFDYAARHHVLLHPGEPQVSYRATEWAERNIDAFCNGYSHASGADPREQDALLRAYVADKAVYEAVYEARYRPNWLPVPLAAIARIVGAAGRPGTDAPPVVVRRHRESR